MLFSSVTFLPFRKYAKFKNELNALKVSYIVSHTTGRFDKELSRPQSKIGMIHEQLLLNLEDREIDYILSVIFRTSNPNNDRLLLI